MIRKIIALFLACLLLFVTVSIAEDTWICPSCGKEAHGNFCSNCGSKKPDEKWICPSCGAQAEGKFCSNCGTARDSSVQAPSSSSALRETVRQLNDYSYSVTYRDGDNRLVSRIICRKSDNLVIGKHIFNADGKIYKDISYEENGDISLMHIFDYDSQGRIIRENIYEGVQSEQPPINKRIECYIFKYDNLGNVYYKYPSTDLFSNYGQAELDLEIQEALSDDMTDWMLYRGGSIQDHYENDY